MCSLPASNNLIHKIFGNGCGRMPENPPSPPDAAARGTIFAKGDLLKIKTPTCS
jgi:hypothetical protein